MNELIWEDVKSSDGLRWTRARVPGGWIYQRESGFWTFPMALEGKPYENFIPTHVFVPDRE